MILLTARWCSICPAAKALWRELKGHLNFDYEEVDVESVRGRELIERYSVSSVPTSIIDGKVAFSGVPVRFHAERFLTQNRVTTEALP